MSTDSVFNTLKQLVRRLRDPETGCPWDKVQTHESLKPYLVEEAYEVLEAIDDKSPSLRDELGDVLYQVFIHAELAGERREFEVEDVAQALIDKLIRRHPHVFGTTEVSGVEDVLKNWESIKRNEKGVERASALDGIPKALPALMKAQRLGDKASRVGFDWNTGAAILDKVIEELTELEEAGSDEHRAEEFGDLLFVIAQWARKNELDSELCLERANQKFERRFKGIERLAGKELGKLTLDEQEALWERVKADERS